jgi:trk system potassium uptake protein TrkH
MLAPAVSFNLYYIILKRGAAGLRAAAGDPELRLFAAILGVSAITICAGLISNATFDSAFNAISASIFQSVSILTTTGYVSADFNLWPLLCVMILFLLMFVGSCGSSLGGGLKTFRALLLIKLIGRGIFIRQYPNAVFQIKAAEKAVPAEALSKAAGCFFIYISLFAIGSLLISLDNMGLTRSAGAVISALGNVGPMFCESGSPLDYSGFSYRSKLLLALLMLSGKLIFSYGTERLYASKL